VPTPGGAKRAAGVVPQGRDRIVGVISERDIVKAIAARGAGVLSEAVSAIMTREVVTCAEGETIDQVMGRMTRGRFRPLPVVKAGRLAGIAAEGAAKGYADNVRILFAWDPLSRKVTGFSVVAARETPGIGDKVSKDRDFLANFPLAAEVAADGKALIHEIRTVKHGTKTQPWEIDAIAGATITSRAVGRAINDTAQALLPRIAPHLDQLKEKS
jgi:RnfABCDGE-type electron transport complex G subunit